MFSKWLSSEPELSAAEVIELRALCESVAQKIQGTGRDTPAFSNWEKPIVPGLVRARMGYMKTYNELLAESLKDGGSGDSRTMMWKFFTKMGYVPTSDMFGRVQDEDIIEIYAMDGTQIYRNLRYFEYVSASIEDLVGMHWQKAYKRNKRVTLHLALLMYRFAKGAVDHTYDCLKIPVHPVREMIGRKNTIELQFKYLSPLKKDGKCVALVVGTRCRILPAS